MAIMPPPSTGKGEVLKIGPPASGEVIIVVDPGRTGTSFAAGTETLLPRAEIPPHRHLDRDEALFIHKGQARAVLNERAMVVLPGMTLHVPRGTWFSLRNTGTGALQFVWVSSPGLEAFFRDCSRLGASPSAEALQELGRRHRIEFRPAAERPTPAAAPSPAGHRRRGHRGGRRHRGEPRPTPATPSGSAVTPPPVRVEPSSASAAPPAPRLAPSAAPAAPSAPAIPGGRGRRRHRRGGAGRREPTGGAPAAPAPAPSQQPPRPEARGQRPRRDRHRRRVKEVYMDGRWVQVEGEGPVIAPGRGSPDRRGPKLDDDDPSSTPLSVSL